MEATNKEVIFTRPHKTIYATEDKIIKVFDNRYTKAEVLNEARNEALVEGKDPGRTDKGKSGEVRNLHGNVC